MNANIDLQSIELARLTSLVKMKLKHWLICLMNVTQFQCLKTDVSTLCFRSWQ